MVPMLVGERNSEGTWLEAGKEATAREGRLAQLLGRAWSKQENMQEGHVRRASEGLSRDAAVGQKKRKRKGQQAMRELGPGLAGNKPWARFKAWRERPFWGLHNGLTQGLGQNSDGLDLWPEMDLTSGPFLGLQAPQK